MASASPADPRRTTPSWAVPLFAGLIACAGLAAYANSFSAPFLFDDRGAIADNPTIRHLGSAFFPPPGGMPVSGRPLVNLSLALNYGLSGGRTWSYHALNLLIHLLAGWTLFGVVRRTLRRTGSALAASADGLAFAVALCWTVHPLQTESVTYLSQRAESLMGLCYLLTLYGFIRYAAGQSDKKTGRSAWAVLSILACFFGMASKEAMVTAPLVVFLYDRTFLAGGFREAWRRRRGFYAALGASWLLLAALVAGSGSRGGTAGFGSSLAWWAYAFTQLRAVAHYLRLCLWPRPLVFAYGLTLGGPPLEMAADGAVVVALLLATIVLVARGSRLGFLGAAFFLILAPTSSILPISTEIVAEHRVYLPLAAVIAAVVCGAAAAAARWAGGRRWAPLAGWLALAAAAGALGTGTFVRNEAYRSKLAFWRDAAEKAPDNPGARNNYGNALVEAGRTAEATAQFEAALRLVPDYDDANYNYGNLLAREGRWPEALRHYRVAIRFRDDSADWHYALGNALAHTGSQREADAQYERALGASSAESGVWYNLGNAFLDEGKLPEADQAYAKAIALRPDYGDALVNDAGVLAQLGRGPAAVRAFQAALRIEPDAPDVHNNLGGLLAAAGRLDEAKAEFAEALRLKPDYREARDNLARVEAMQRARSPR